MAVSKQPTITPETSSGEGLDEEPSSRGEAKWKRFHPFRVVRKIFRRRIKREGTNVVSDSSKKSWSTSELQSVQDDSTGKCEVTSPLKIGLSVSHDSIFSPENNANIVNNETLDVPHCSSLSVRHTSMKNMFKDELFTRIRARRDSDEDDGIGMQSSPYSSPTTIDILNQGFKEKLPKSQTTCSAGSLISMGSSENDEDSTGQSSGHSSRMSLIDRRSLDSEADSEAANPVPLNHNAAHHKIAVRPKRTHGLPRRRVKQVAASKVTSLPSTPEVTEDPSKNMQFEITERSKSTNEYSMMSEKSVISTSVSSAEKLTTFHSSTISYNEVSQHSSEIQCVKEKMLSESSSYARTHTEEDQMWIQSQCDLDEEMIITTSDNATTIFESNEESNSEQNSFEESNESLIDKIEDSEIESYKLVKNALQEKPVCDTIVDDYLANTSESSVNVSSLVRSIEKSDSFKNTGKSRKPADDTKHYEKFSEHLELFDRKTNKESDGANLNQVEESKISLHDVQNGVQEITESVNLTSPQSLKMTSVDCVNETIKKSPISEKLDIDSEFVLKPLKKDRRFSGENDLPNTEVVSENKKDSSLVSSVFLEEESIMSNKSLSVGIEESRIFVSHHSSSSDDVKDILVTEAHNYVTVEEKSEISIQSGEDAISTKRRDVSDPYVSSVGITSSAHSGVVYTSSSNACDKRMSEDVITISVNSNSCNMKSNSVPIQNTDRISPTSLQKRLPSATENNSNQKMPEKQFKSLQKSHLPDVGSNTHTAKNANSQKRVSVEIVPFSQRMKERKYQPISFANKECSSENKKNSSSQVERKLSDRKVTKNKDLDKSNNRHSFSGTYNSESKKDGDLITSKKETKNEKVQYPVQIRIHKTKPEIKDKNSVTANTFSEFKDSNKEVKINMNSAKVTQNDVKHMKENKVLESTPKWEIKIQPATPSHVPISHGVDSEENTSSVLSQNNFILKSESFKSSQFSVNENKDNSADLENSVTKHLDTNWKSPKEATVASDDPEPELLRVFARRSIKQKHCDKDKDETEKQSNTSPNDPPVRESIDKNKDMISISLNSTVIKISEISKPHITKPDLKKKSKSFCEKEKVVPRSVSPLKEMNLIQRDSPARSSVDSLISNENLHPRQRIANLDDTPHTLPLESEKKIGNKNAQMESTVDNSSKEEHLHRPCSITTPPPSTSVNGNLSSIGMVKENQEMAGKDAHTPAWLQLAQQRRELREQRERLLLGGSPNSFIEASSKPSRSSKVWDMVNNFQKLQMT